MKLQQLLQAQENSIIDEAAVALERSRLKHYAAAGEGWNRERLTDLFGLTRDCVANRDLVPMIDHMETIAQQRFSAGFDIHEVQTAVNVLKESVWRHISQNLEANEQAEAFGLVGTVLGAGKDALARAYVSLASQSKAPSLNLSALFAGTDGV
jgi:hypothetical protein